MKAIPELLEGPILEKSSEGWSARHIAKWLEKEHNHKVSYGSIIRFIDQRRAERAGVTKDVLREKLSKTVLSDIEVLELERERLSALSARFYELAKAEEPSGSLDNPRYLATETYLRVADRAAKFVEMKLKYSGAEEPDAHADLATAGERVASRIARLLAPSGRDPGKPDGEGEGGP